MSIKQEVIRQVVNRIGQYHPRSGFNASVPLDQTPLVGNPLKGGATQSFTGVVTQDRPKKKRPSNAEIRNERKAEAKRLKALVHQISPINEYRHMGSALWTLQPDVYTLIGCEAFAFKSKEHLDILYGTFQTQTTSMGDAQDDNNVFMQNFWAPNKYNYLGGTLSIDIRNRQELGVEVEVFRFKCARDIVTVETALTDDIVEEQTELTGTVMNMIAQRLNAYIINNDEIGYDLLTEKDMRGESALRDTTGKPYMLTEDKYNGYVIGDLTTDRDAVCTNPVALSASQGNQYAGYNGAWGKAWAMYQHNQSHMKDAVKMGLNTWLSLEGYDKFELGAGATINKFFEFKGLTYEPHRYTQNLNALLNNKVAGTSFDMQGNEISAAEAETQVNIKQLVRGIDNHTEIVIFRCRSVCSPLASAGGANWTGYPTGYIDVVWNRTDKCQSIIQGARKRVFIKGQAPGTFDATATGNIVIPGDFQEEDLKQDEPL